MAGDIGRRHLLQGGHSRWYSRRGIMVFFCLFLWGRMSSRQEPYRFHKHCVGLMWEFATLWATSQVWTEYEQQKTPPVVQEQYWAKHGCLLKGLSSVRFRDLSPPQLLLSCLSQALQRIGLWLKSSMRGDWGEMTEEWRSGQKRRLTEGVKSVLVSSTLSFATESYHPAGYSSVSENTEAAKAGAWVSQRAVSLSGSEPEDSWPGPRADEVIEGWDRGIRGWRWGGMLRL